MVSEGQVAFGMSWEQVGQHGAYRFDNSIHETMHIQPGNIEFWTDTTYSTGSAHNAIQFNLSSSTSRKYLNLELEEFTFSANQGGGLVDRVRLDYNGLSVINAGSWPAYNLDATNGRGELKLYNGSGVRNVTVGYASSDVSDGLVYIYDNTDALQAGMYINSMNQGVLFADVKNFRMPHPHKSDKEIWYASLEGPEAGAYDRGTTQLIDGEAFVPYSAHYNIVANPETATVQLTAQHWDTYGLAVVAKSKNGFYVKELKGGTGSFQFDWEVKAVRKGKEDYKVIRTKAMIPHANSDELKAQKMQPRSSKKSNHLQQHKKNPSCGAHPH